MSQETQGDVEVSGNTTKLLSIGRAWVNDRVNEAGTSPAVTIRIDNNLGINIKLGAGAQVLMFTNPKREGKQDADYRVAVAVPAEVADREIARQREISAANTVQVEEPTAAELADIMS